MQVEKCGSIVDCAARQRARACSLFSHCAPSPHQYSASIKPTFKMCRLWLTLQYVLRQKWPFQTSMMSLNRINKENLSQQWARPKMKTVLCGSSPYENTISMSLVKRSYYIAKDDSLHDSLNEAILRLICYRGKPLKYIQQLELYLRKVATQGSQSKTVGQQWWGVVSRLHILAWMLKISKNGLCHI